MSTAHPDEVLAKLKAEFGTNKRAHNNLDALHQVCREISATDRVYSLSSVGRRLQARIDLGQTAPAPLSLRSTKGKHFRTLLNAWKEYDGVVKVAPKVVPASGDQQLLAGIQNGVVRELVGMKLAELKRLRTENNDLKSITKMPVDMRRVVTSDAPQVISASESLTDTERTAMSSLLDPSWLKRRGWKEGSHGSVVWDSPGKPPGPVLLPGTQSAIRKLTTAQKRLN